MMDIRDAVYGRRSVRTFSNKPVDLALVRNIIDFGIQAPTACNIQGWKFVVINSSPPKEWLVSMGSPTFIRDAPVGVLVAYDNRSSNKEYLDYIQSAAAAMQNMCLAAHSYSLGACWICRLPPQDKVRSVFGIPEQYAVIAYLALGYGAHSAKPVPRKYALDEVVSVGAFTPSKLTPETVKRWAYLLIPQFIKSGYRMLFKRK